MNETIRRVIEMMFEGTEETEEVKALRDEVLANAQDRYEDCRGHGLTEDEAVGAVLESLKGMSEVIDEYPKKQRPRVQKVVWDDGHEDNFDEETPSSYLFTDDIRKLDVNLLDEDVTIRASEDNAWHVELEDGQFVNVEVTDGTLNIGRKKGPSVQFVWHNKKTERGNDESLGGWISRIVNQSLNSIGRSVSFGGGGDVTVYVPTSAAVALSLHNTSGDIRVDDVRMTELRCDTLSGSADIHMLPDNRLPSVYLKSTSGDFDAQVYADRLQLNTLSGDFDITGECGDLKISTTSGDVDFSGSFTQATGRTVSGDITLRKTDLEKTQIDVSSTSGDVDIYIPREMTACVALRSTSGSAWSRCHGRGDGTDDVQVRGSSVSGDIRVENC